MKLYLVRHGEIDNKYLGKYIGGMDILLSEVGLAQAKRLAYFFKDKNIGTIFTSPLKRCSDTAEIINEHLEKKVLIEDSIPEFSFRPWEGKTSEEIINSVGSSSAEKEYKIFAKRVKSFLNRILKKYRKRNVLIVSHKGVNREMLRYFLGHDKAILVEQDFGCLNIIDVDKSITVEALNQTL